MVAAAGRTVALVAAAETTTALVAATGRTAAMVAAAIGVTRKPVNDRRPSRPGYWRCFFTGRFHIWWHRTGRC
jgi:hypothetical protein